MVGNGKTRALLTYTQENACEAFILARAHWLHQRKLASNWKLTMAETGVQIIILIEQKSLLRKLLGAIHVMEVPQLADEKW